MSELNHFTKACLEKHGKAKVEYIIKARLESEPRVPWKDVLAKVEINHSLAELVVFEAEGRRAGLKPLPATEANVSWCRVSQRLSWGLIAAWCQVPESKVRAFFKAGKGEHSDAQRIGKGGRWKFNDPELYVGDLKPTGTVIPAGAKLVREVAELNATQQRLIKLTPAELKAECERVGFTPAKGATKAKTVIELAKVIGSPSKVNAS